MLVFVGTAGWLALVNRSDQLHEQAVAVYRTLGKVPRFTPDAVLVETCSRPDLWAAATRTSGPCRHSLNGTALPGWLCRRHPPRRSAPAAASVAAAATLCRIQPTPWVRAHCRSSPIRPTCSHSISSRCAAGGRRLGAVGGLGDHGQGLL